MHLYCLLSVLLSVTATALPNANWTVGQTVRTTSGLIQGHVAAWPSNSSVSEYLGIPYAQPPLGDLRFAPAQSYTSNESFLADSFSADCMQYTGGQATANVSAAVIGYGYGMGGGSASVPHTYSEDCLSVNVWTKPQVGEKSKAVMIWIYGGGFYAGTSNAPFYNGARFVDEEDVVVVSFNYRINIFGFPGAPGLSDQNLGLLDQRLAVEWVRDNIAAFNGDPERITLFGESAGGFSVDYYSFAWTEDPIVNGFIAESGSAFTNTGQTNANFSSGWYNVSASLGCGGIEAGNTTLPCMRSVSAEDLINTVGTGGETSAFGPIADGKVVFADVRERAAAGNFIQRPLLIGNNDNELGLTLAIPGSLGSTPIPPSYFPIANDMTFNCPAATSASARATNNVPVWRYRYMPVWPNTALVDGMGAYHSSEIPVLFGTTTLKPNASADTREEGLLGSEMRAAWAGFAKDPENALGGMGWPMFQPNGTAPGLTLLGYNNRSELVFTPGGEYDTLCANLTSQAAVRRSKYSRLF